MRRRLTTAEKVEGILLVAGVLLFIAAGSWPEHGRQLGFAGGASCFAALLLQSWGRP